MAQVQYYGTGRRKKAIARVRLLPGDGRVTVNSKDLDDYIGIDGLRKQVRRPLEVTGTANKFNVVASVEGGGTSGQVGALRHGIARALLEAGADYRPLLKREGFLTRDPRMKERKKYGLKKARRAPQFSKR